MYRIDRNDCSIQRIDKKYEIESQIDRKDRIDRNNRIGESVVTVTDEQRDITQNLRELIEMI